MSLPNSLGNSFKKKYQTIHNKENENPNFPTCQGNTPEYTKQLNTFSQLPSFLLRSIRQGTHSQGTQQSLKTIIRQFYQEHDDTQKNYKPQTKKLLAILKCYFDKNSMTLRQAISLCENNEIYNFDNIKQKTQNEHIYSSDNKNRMKSMKQLMSDLGLLKIEYLCQCLRYGQTIDQQQEKILILLFNEVEQNKEITESMIWQVYENYIQENKAEYSELQQLQHQFLHLYSLKIENKLQNKRSMQDFFNQIDKMTYKEVISFNSVHNILSKLIGLSTQEAKLVFKYLYSLQHNQIMLLVDPTAKVSTSIVLNTLMRKRAQPQIKNSEKNKEYLLEDSYRTIIAINEQNRKMGEVIRGKDEEIERLYKVIEMLEFEATENGSINSNKIELEKQNWRQKYDKKITELEQRLQEQKKVSRWYQRELQSIIKSINKQNVVRRHLENGMQGIYQS